MPNKVDMDLSVTKDEGMNFLQRIDLFLRKLAESKYLSLQEPEYIKTWKLTLTLIFQEVRPKIKKRNISAVEKIEKMFGEYNNMGSISFTSTHSSYSTPQSKINYINIRKKTACLEKIEMIMREEMDQIGLFLKEEEKQKKIF